MDGVYVPVGPGKAPWESARCSVHGTTISRNVIPTSSIWIPYFACHPFAIFEKNVPISFPIINTYNKVVLWFLSL